MADDHGKLDKLEYDEASNLLTLNFKDVTTTILLDPITMEVFDNGETQDALTEEERAFIESKVNTNLVAFKATDQHGVEYKRLGVDGNVMVKTDEYDNLSLIHI